jgi:tetratricopeptide (TPR) repeat protein
MTLKELARLFKAYCKGGNGASVRRALDEHQRANEYPGAEFYTLAAAFYLTEGDIPRLRGALDCWKKCKGDPIEPYEWYCDLGREGSVPQDVLKQNLEVVLARKPHDPASLLLAYRIAVREDNWARRLCYALELAKHGKTADDHVRYGIECGRNAMPERAEEAFNKALGLAPTHVGAIVGLALCAFEKMELGRAEELFRRALKADPENEWAPQELAKIAKIRKGEPWVKRAEARRKFWKHWQDTELIRLTDEQRRKRMAEVVGRKR